MVEIELDGKKVEVLEGSMVMHAAEAAGAYIPHFCYHKKLSIAANCRMCLVEVEKAPKPMPACATPVTQGMIVRTNSDKAVRAQKSVMEFLLINHPLDCPICDQGGECQLQDLAVGYGGSASRYDEEKRVVANKEVGPLISMEEMSRCIHCTRCVRFGQEVAGVMELGMSNRGEHSEIETFLGKTIDSELSGNMIDICPVGALTSKPFRYSARTWELSRRKSISPHDSAGANLMVQVKANKVMRVLPLENEAVNECWIADRDRFSYEALNSSERLTKPMLKQGGVWQEVEWPAALEYVAGGLKQIAAEFGAQSVGMLASPHATVEELYLAADLMRKLGSENIDTRLRHADFTPHVGVHWLGLPIAALSNLQAALVLGSNLRKDHPLFAQRIRQAAKKGARISEINEVQRDWALPVAHSILSAPKDWLHSLAEVCAAVAEQKSTSAPTNAPIALQASEAAKSVAASLLKGERKAILLGNAAAHHAEASQILALANWLGEQTGASVGYLTEAANTVGAALVGAHPKSGGLHAKNMLEGGLKAALLLNTEPAQDSAYGESGLVDTKMVVSLSPFKANMHVADVMLPIAPFTETAGSFVNAEGRLQSFYSVVQPLGEARPAWKVLRVLANMLGLSGFEFNTAQEVLAAAVTADSIADKLSNQSAVAVSDVRLLSNSAAPAPVVASIYALDGIVRRAASLQATHDAKNIQAEEVQA